MPHGYQAYAHHARSSRQQSRFAFQKKLKAQAKHNNHDCFAGTGHSHGLICLLSALQPQSHCCCGCTEWDQMSSALPSAACWHRSERASGNGCWTCWTASGRAACIDTEPRQPCAMAPTQVIKFCVACLTKQHCLPSFSQVCSRSHMKVCKST